MNGLRLPCLVLVLIAVCFCLIPSPASSQSGAIMLFSDSQATDCAFTDAGSLVTVYIWYMHSPDSRGVRFRLNVDDAGWTHLGDTVEFDITSGTTVDGVIICWDDCLSGNIGLVTVHFFGTSAPACTEIFIDAYPEAGVEALDCNFDVFNPAAGMGYVNPDGTCPCSACTTGAEAACASKVGPTETAASNFCATVPVEQSTWGLIKALYHN